MEDSLEREVQLGASELPPASVAAEACSALDEEVGDSRLSPTVQAVILRMLEGTEPLGRSLKPWEVLKFSPTHVNICTLRAAGFKNKEIAQMVGLEPCTISVTLNHPYGRKLLGLLVPKNSARVLDIRTRLSEYASELLDKTYSEAMVSDDVELVTKVTFGLLDRAGYSAKTSSSEDAQGKSAIFTESTLKRLTSAMEASNSIDSVIMPTYVPSRPPEEALVGSEVVGASADLTPRRGVSEPASSASGSQLTPPVEAAS